MQVLYMREWPIIANMNIIAEGCGFCCSKMKNFPRTSSLALLRDEKNPVRGAEIDVLSMRTQIENSLCDGDV